MFSFFFFQAEDGIRDLYVTGVQTCALPISEWMKKSNRQNFAHADMADPKVLNAVIWFACTGSGSNIPQTAQLPAYQAMRLGIAKVDDGESVSKKDDDD